ncbi:MAG: hypothetical protein K8H86_06200 [Ignavibacteriaceae bacterium]|nr:hypothetical protein [Ignavibacteriaceae bacterium]
MIFVTKKILFITAVVSTLSFAQTEPELQYNYAVKLYNSENYFDAITELKRLRFFDDKNEYSNSSNYLIAKSYKAGAKFDDAIRYFTLAEIENTNQERYFNLRIEIVRCNILRRTTDRAMQILSSLENDSAYKSKSNQINYWRGWALMFNDRFDEASKQFANINPNHPLKLFAEGIDDKLYSVPVAKSLSYLIPGAGQFYTGNYFSGTLSFGWNLLWGYLTVNAFIQNRIFDGFMVGNLLWFRFYRGNFQNAEKFALEENVKIINDGFYFLQTGYSGEKP